MPNWYGNASHRIGVQMDLMRAKLPLRWLVLSFCATEAFEMCNSSNRAEIPPLTIQLCEPSTTRAPYRSFLHRSRRALSRLSSRSTYADANIHFFSLNSWRDNLACCEAAGHWRH